MSSGHAARSGSSQRYRNAWCHRAARGRAHADTVAQLPVTGFTQIVADTAHHHLFLGSFDGCGHLNSSSKGAWALTISQAHLNSPYRIRADYIRSSADTSNLSSDSGWQYFLVAK